MTPEEQIEKDESVTLKKIQNDSLYISQKDESLLEENKDLTKYI